MKKFTVNVVDAPKFDSVEDLEDALLDGFLKARDAAGVETVEDKIKFAAEFQEKAKVLEVYA